MQDIKTKCPSSALYVEKSILQYPFSMTGITMKDTNGEFVETMHSSLRRYEETHGTKIVRKKGTPQHLIQSVRTLTSYNSRRAGYLPAHEITIHKVKPSQSPLVQSHINLK